MAGGATTMTWTVGEDQTQIRHNGWLRRRTRRDDCTQGLTGNEAFASNGDGRVTFEEMEQGMGDLQVKFDAHGNGTLWLDGFEALYASVMREHMVAMFQDLDSDGDGEVTVDEMQEPARMFERMRRYWSEDGSPGSMIDDGPIMNDD